METTKVDTNTRPVVEKFFAREWQDSLNDKDYYKDLMLGFARVGVFNPRTAFDQAKTWRLWAQGNLTEMGEYWLMHRWAPNDPVVLKRVSNTVIERKGHARKNSYYHKSFTIEEQVAPLQVTAHALKRYREREGVFVDTKLFWHNLPPLLSSISETDSTRRKDILLPTPNGAWLGEVLACTSTMAHFIYKKGDFDIQETSDTFANGFRAFSYVSYMDMFPYQKQIWELHQEGRHTEANKVQEENINQNQCEEIEKSIVVDVTKLI